MWVDNNRLERWSKALETIAGGLLVLCAARVLIETPLRDWSANHLAPAAALLHGISLYHGPTEGVVMDMMYGPMSVFAYLPAAWIPSPTAAVVAAQLLAFAYYFVPVILFFRGLPKLALVTFALLSFHLNVLSGSACWVHADAPALGLALAACWFLEDSRRSDTARFWLSAVCVVLSVWTKQVTLPLFAALPLYVAWREGHSKAFHYSAALAATGLAIGFLFIKLFGGRELLFNLVTVPRLQPWILDKPAAVMKAGLELLITSIVPLVLIFLFGMRSKDSSDASAPCWELPLWVGVMMIPTAVLGRVKIGGSYNALSFTVYFLCLSALMALGKAAIRDARAKMLLCAWTMGLLLFLIPSTGLYFAALPFRVSRITHNPQRLVYEAVKKYPGQVYAPWGGLPTVMAEGTIYHFDYALWDRALAGFPVSQAHLKAHLPAQMRWVIFPPQAQDQKVMASLPEFSERTEWPGYPEWTIYQRPTPQKVVSQP